MKINTNQMYTYKTGSECIQKPIRRVQMIKKTVYANRIELATAELHVRCSTDWAGLAYAVRNIILCFDVNLSPSRVWFNTFC